MDPQSRGLTSATKMEYFKYIYRTLAMMGRPRWGKTEEILYIEAVFKKVQTELLTSRPNLLLDIKKGTSFNRTLGYVLMPEPSTTPERKGFNAVKTMYQCRCTVVEKRSLECDSSESESYKVRRLEQLHRMVRTKRDNHKMMD